MLPLLAQTYKLAKSSACQHLLVTTSEIIARGYVGMARGSPGLHFLDIRKSPEIYKETGEW